MLSHQVFFKLKDSSPAAIEALLAACRKYLPGHEGTTFFACGTLTPDLVRPVNQRDWHVAVNVVFANRAAHDAYQVSERHQTFIRETRDNWAEARVFDADM